LSAAAINLGKAIDKKKQQLVNAGLDPKVVLETFKKDPAFKSSPATFTSTVEFFSWPNSKAGSSRLSPPPTAAVPSVETEVGHLFLPSAFFHLLTPQQPATALELFDLEAVEADGEDSQVAEVDKAAPRTYASDRDEDKSSTSEEEDDKPRKPRRRATASSSSGMFFPTHLCFCF
jgi:hypothetical protein